MLKNWYINRVQQRLAKHFRATCQRIDPALFDVGAMRYNYKCHLNAVHEQHVDSSLGIFLVYSIDAEDFGFLHVINRTTAGRYVDNTLGADSFRHQHFYIKEILPDNYQNIERWFQTIRQDYISLHSRVWLCKLLGIEPVDIF